MQGTIYSIKGNKAISRGEDDLFYSLRPGKGLPKQNESIISVGDKVEFEVFNEEDGNIVKVLERRNKISRPDPWHQGKVLVIASNIDQLLIISSLASPVFSPGLVDRFLILAFRENIPPVLIVNKCELDDEMPEALSYYMETIPTILCSAKTGKNLDQVVDMVQNKRSLLAGHSGVGKSSLINAIMPDVNIKTAPLRKKIEKGRHTTTHSMTYEFDQNSYLIDSPGIKKFNLRDIDVLELQWYFPEFDDFSYQCKFSNCRHISEPNCEVKNAVDQGMISLFRYQSYKRILEENL